MSTDLWGFFFIGYRLLVTTGSAVTTMFADDSRFDNAVIPDTA